MRASMTSSSRRSSVTANRKTTLIEHILFREKQRCLIVRDSLQGAPSTDLVELRSGNVPVDEMTDVPDDAHRAVRGRMDNCHPSSPLRSLDWRWKLACMIRDGFPRPRRIGGDRWFHSTLRLRARMEPMEGDPRVYRTCRDRHLDIAHQIRFGADHRLRLELEARLLSGQHPAAVASHVGAEAGVVEAYGRAFYDVADHLDHPDYIMALAIGSSAYTGLTADQVEVIVKLIAFNIGPLALDALGRRLGWPTSFAAATPSALAAALDRKLETLIEVMTLPITDETTPALIRIAARLLEVERRAKDGSHPPLACSIRPVTPFWTADQVPSGAQFGHPLPILDARMDSNDSAIDPRIDAATTTEAEHQVALAA